MVGMHWGRLFQRFLCGEQKATIEQIEENLSGKLAFGAC